MLVIKSHQPHRINNTGENQCMKNQAVNSQLMQYIPLFYMRPVHEQTQPTPDDVLEPML